MGISRVTRDYEAFRTNEFHWRGSPPSAVAWHYGKNPKALKYDGTHAIDHDRVAVDEHLRAEAWDACAKYTDKVATEVCNQEFENMLVNSANVAHDKATTQYSQLRTPTEKAHSKLVMQQATELHKAYKEKLMYDAYEAHKLVFC